jgi:hypothetical protein
MTSADVRTAMRARFTSPEWALFFEVGDGTGAHQHRWADAVAMNLWPSRGLALHGFEIKVSRSDWRAELKNPAKAESVSQYCDHWWIVTPTGVVPQDELPDTWGLFEVNPAGKLKQVVAAPKREAKPAGRPFIAALLRRAGQVDEEDIRKAVMARTEKIREEFKKSSERDLDSRTRRFQEVLDKVAKIKSSTGIDLLHWAPTEEVSAAIRFVLTAGALNSYGGIDRIRNSLRRALEQMDQAVEEAQGQRLAVETMEVGA